MDDAQRFSYQLPVQVSLLRSLWLAYVLNEDPELLRRFASAQSTLYLARALAVAGNYHRASALLPPPFPYAQ